MSKRRKWVIAVAGAVLGIVLFTLLTREHEPYYKGKSLSEWLEVEAYQGADDENNGPSAEAIRAIGTNAVPYLVKWASYAFPRNRLNWHQTLGGKLTGIAPTSVCLWLVEDRNEKRAHLAQTGFVVLGERANGAIPALAALMNDHVATNHSPQAATNRSARAAAALAFIGKAAIPSLSAQLANTNCSYRRIIAAKFGEFPGLATNDAVLPPLLHSLKDPDPTVISFAATALGRIAEHDRSRAALVVPALTNCLASPNAKSVRERVAWTLAIYGSEARASVPQLLQLTSDPDWGVREAATNALLKIAPEELTNAPAVVPDLREPRSERGNSRP